MIVRLEQHDIFQHCFVFVRMPCYIENLSSLTVERKWTEFECSAIPLVCPAH